jgi:hypothetical protein
MTADPDGHVGVDHGVHGRGEERDLEAEASELGREIDLRRVRGHGPRNQRDLLERRRRAGGASRIASRTGGWSITWASSGYDETRAAGRRGHRSLLSGI